MDYQVEKPRTNDPTPTTHQDAPRSLSNHQTGPKKPVEPSALDNFLKRDEAFFRRESRLLAVVAARMRVPMSEMEDLLQEAWLSAVEHRDQFEEVELKPRLHGWMRAVIYGKAVDLQRHLGCRSCQSLSEEAIDLIDETPARSAAMAELREWLDALLAEASQGNEENLRLLHAFFFQERSINELAQQFGMTGDAVKGRIRRLAQRARALAKRKPSRKSKGAFDFAGSEKKK